MEGILKAEIPSAKMKKEIIVKVCQKGERERRRKGEEGEEEEEEEEEG